MSEKCPTVWRVESILCLESMDLSTFHSFCYSCSGWEEKKLIAAKTIYRGSLKKELNAFKLLTSNSLFTLIQIMHEFARLLAFSSGLVSVHTKKSALVATQMRCYKPNIQSAYWPDVSAARATKVNKRKTNVVIWPNIAAHPNESSGHFTASYYSLCTLLHPRMQSIARRYFPQICSVFLIVWSEWGRVTVSP